MAAIQNVTIAGATGSLGKAVLEQVVAAGFNVRVLQRKGSAPASVPAGVEVVAVDYTSVEELTATLKGQDAVVSALAADAVGDAQLRLIDAAVAAGVARFLPSEFGSDLDVDVVRKLPVFAGKVAVQEFLRKAAASSDLTYTLVYNSAFLDWGLESDFLFKIPDPTIYDGGSNPVSYTNLSSVGAAVVAVLRHPAETRNRSVRVADITLSQNQLLALAKKAAPTLPWQPKAGSIDAAVAGADKRLAQGLYDFTTFFPYLLRSILDPAYGSNLSKNNDNALLGIKGLTDDDVVELFKKIIAKKNVK